MAKKFLCSLEKSPTKHPKMVMSDCIPCYEETNIHSKLFKTFIGKKFEYLRPGLEILPIEKVKVLMAFDDKWDYLGEAIVYNDEIIMRNIGPCDASSDELSKLISYLEENDVWSLEDCHYNWHIEL